MKIQRITDFQHRISFLSATENLDAFYSRFLESDFGKIHEAIPWDSLIESFGITEKSAGSKMGFSPKREN